MAPNVPYMIPDSTRGVPTDMWPGDKGRGNGKEPHETMRERKAGVQRRMYHSSLAYTIVEPR